MISTYKPIHTHARTHTSIEHREQESGNFSKQAGRDGTTLQTATVLCTYSQAVKSSAHLSIFSWMKNSLHKKKHTPNLTSQQDSNRTHLFYNDSAESCHTGFIYYETGQQPPNILLV